MALPGYGIGLTDGGDPETVPPSSPGVQAVQNVAVGMPPATLPQAPGYGNTPAGAAIANPQGVLVGPSSFPTLPQAAVPEGSTVQSLSHAHFTLPPVNFRATLAQLQALGAAVAKTIFPTIPSTYWTTKFLPVILYGRGLHGKTIAFVVLGGKVAPISLSNAAYCVRWGAPNGYIIKGATGVVAGVRMTLKTGLTPGVIKGQAAAAKAMGGSAIVVARTRNPTTFMRQKGVAVLKRTLIKPLPPKTADHVNVPRGKGFFGSRLVRSKSDPAAPIQEVAQDLDTAGVILGDALATETQEQIMMKTAAYAGSWGQTHTSAAVGMKKAIKGEIPLKNIPKPMGDEGMSATVVYIDENGVLAIAKASDDPAFVERMREFNMFQEWGISNRRPGAD